jgi:predicted Zn-dependent protease with MMP-like domain
MSGQVAIGEAPMGEAPGAEAIERIAREAIARLPAEFAAHLGDVVLIVMPMTRRWPRWASIIRST